MAVQKFLDASILHISISDRTLLCCREDKFPTRVIPHDHGWWVNVPEKKELSEYVVRMCLQGFSSSFVRLLVAASDCDCWWINLDTDGDMWECLELHEDPELQVHDEEKAFAVFEENEARASRAEIALKAYDLTTDKLGTLNIEHVVDLITDLQHYCRLNDLSYTQPLQRARKHFHAEIAEEIFGHESESYRNNNARYYKDEIIIVPEQRVPGVPPGQIKIRQDITGYVQRDSFQNATLFDHGDLDISIAITPFIPAEINDNEDVVAYLVDLLTPLVARGGEIEIQIGEGEV
jgi:hypothetical protein